MNFSSLSEFLKQYPWQKELNELNIKEIDTLDFLWEFELKSSPEELWPYLSDTSTTNQKLGLPPMEFQEKNGKLFGKSKNLGILLEWEEVPWEWKYPEWIRNARIYSKGFAKYVRAMYLFNKIDNTKTKLFIYFGWIPKNIFGKILLKIAMPRIYKKYNEFLKNLDKNIKENKTEQYFEKIDQNILLKIYKRYEEIQDAKLLKNYISIWNYLTNQKQSFLNMIRIKKIAKDLNISLEQLLEFFLISTKKGFFLLSWSIICPHCRGIRKELNNIGELPDKEYCEACEVEIETSNYNNIEIIFKIHPSIANIKEEFYCAAEPAKKSHILFNQKIEQKQTLKINDLSLLKDKTYRIRWKGQKDYALIKIQDHGEDKLLINEFFQFQNQIINLKKNFELILTNPYENKKEFILEYFEEDELALRPQELFNFQGFRDLFDDQIIQTNIQLDIGIQYLLLADIVGSTKLYIEKGDSYAFRIIKKFFEKSYEIVKNNQGAIVKTIGDAIFASFSTEENLLNCLFELHNTFKKTEEPKIRITINSGKVFAVNLNTGIDYFGNPVNLLAKMEPFLEADQFSVPIGIFERNKVKFTNYNIKKIEKINLKEKDFLFYILE